MALGWPERPPISAPSPPVAAEPEIVDRQPGLGLRGLVLVVPIAWLLAFGAGGAEPSLLVLGPLVTFGLPVVAMVAFWWDDWPGTRLRASWSGWADTLVIAVAAVVLTGVGQAVVARFDLRGIFDPTPGPGHVPAYPVTMPLGGAVFVAMLQFTLVCEGWPLRRLPPVPAGLLALALAWAVGLAAYTGPPGALLVVVGAWQVWFYVAWRGWPFAAIGRRPVRLLAANAAVLGGGSATYVLARAAGAAPADVTAAAGSFIAAGLLVGMLLEDWVQSRAAMLAGIVLLGAAIELALQAYAARVGWTRGGADEWVTHAALNAIGVSVILHVAIGRRWWISRRPAP